MEGIEELVQVLQQLFAVGGVETPDSCLLRRLVQPLDQTIDARIVALGPSVLDVVWDSWLNAPELVDVVRGVVPGFPNRILCKGRVSEALRYLAAADEDRHGEGRRLQHREGAWHGIHAA